MSGDLMAIDAEVARPGSILQDPVQDSSSPVRKLRLSMGTSGCGRAELNFIQILFKLGQDYFGRSLVSRIM